ncbi:hypothetical protein GKQ38_00775 [Candidatus Nanohaloarchaea archaeon]|nr:hypothetical protein GKQ38_00775 [Candidatus Nanohaloarchaea archaeon]
MTENNSEDNENNSSNSNFLAGINNLQSQMDVIHRALQSGDALHGALKMQNSLDQMSKAIPDPSLLVPDIPDFSEILGSLELEPKHWHYNTLKQSYLREEYSVVVILLSTFFESAVTESLEEHMEEVKEEKGTNGSTSFLDDMNFERKLTLARIHGILSENEYSVMNEIRMYRNDYAHNIEAFSPENDKGIDSYDRVDQAIKIYESWFGIEDSMVDELNQEGNP